MAKPFTVRGTFKVHLPDGGNVKAYALDLTREEAIHMRFNLDRALSGLQIPDPSTPNHHMVMVVVPAYFVGFNDEDNPSVHTLSNILALRFEDAVSVQAQISKSIMDQFGSLMTMADTSAFVPQPPSASPKYFEGPGVREVPLSADGKPQCTPHPPGYTLLPLGQIPHGDKAWIDEAGNVFIPEEPDGLSYRGG